MEQGLAAMSAGVQTYGSGAGNTVTHSYGGTVDKTKGKKKVCKGKKVKK